MAIEACHTHTTVIALLYCGHSHGPCPVSERLAKQLSRKNFRFIRIKWTAPKRIFLLS